MFQAVTEADENPSLLVEDRATQTSNKGYDGRVNKSYKNKAFCYLLYIHKPLFRLEKPTE